MNPDEKIYDNIIDPEVQDELCDTIPNELEPGKHII